MADYCIAIRSEMTILLTDTKQNLKGKKMFAVFQIEATKEYQATIYMEQNAAFKEMAEMQLHNPDTKFEIRQFSHVEKLTGKKA